MNKKLPPQAFSFYLGLGQSRSYDAVAKHFGVTKRSVTNLAAKEGWQQKVQASDQAARARAEEKVQETLEEMNERHLKTVQLIQRKALEALRTMPIDTGMDAVRALVLAVEKERLIRGEPTDRTVIDTEALIRREAALWLTTAEEEDWSDAVDPVRPDARGTAGVAPPADL